MIYIHESSKNMAHNHKAILLIEKSLEKFYENELTKKMHNALIRLETTPTRVEITERFATTWAEADFVLKKTKRYRKIDQFIMRVGDHLFLEPPSFQYDIISHEVAHLIQLSLEYQTYHDNMWRTIHEMMGGTGERCRDSPHLL
jgi:hypothetical protein